MKTYQDLIVWQRSMELSVAIYKLTKSFPKEEIYGLTSQIKRAATAIPANIAEGQKRGGRKEFAQFLRIAYASGAELETHLELSKRLLFDKKEHYNEVDSLLSEVMKMLNKLIVSICSINDKP